MKVRTIYFKVSDMNEAVGFWKNFLDIEPHKSTSTWHEFKIGNTRLGFLLNDFNDKYSGSNCVPVFEFPDSEIDQWIKKAKKLGAELVFDGLADQKSLSVVFRDTVGNEFELTKFHD